MLTCLQGGERLRLLAVLAVTNVIRGLHAELVGGEGLQPVWKQSGSVIVRLLDASGCHPPSRRAHWLEIPNPAASVCMVQQRVAKMM